MSSQEESTPKDPFRNQKALPLDTLLLYSFVKNQLLFVKILSILLEGRDFIMSVVDIQPVLLCREL